MVILYLMNDANKKVDWSVVEQDMPVAEDSLAALCTGHTVSEARKVKLARAIELGASQALLAALRDAARVNDGLTVTLPAHRYERLSRGRGWARQGSGKSAVWGEKVQGGYRVGVGSWSVGATDGFSRKDSNDWEVEHVQVGAETWTIGN